MWIEFTKRFDWKPKPAVTIVYKPGHRVSVTRRCGEEAIRLERGVAIRTPRRGERS